MTLMLNQNSGCVITNTCEGPGERWLRDKNRGRRDTKERVTPGFIRNVLELKWNYFGLPGVARFGLYSTSC